MRPAYFHLLFATSIALSTPAKTFSQQLTAPDKLLNEIVNGRATKQGCQIAARVTIESLKNIGLGACAIPEPTGGTKLACAVGGVLKNNKISEAAVKGTTAGCSWVVKKVSENMVEITIDVADETRDTAREVKAWFSFLNTFEGAIWFMNRL